MVVAFRQLRLGRAGDHLVSRRAVLRFGRSNQIPAFVGVYGAKTNNFRGAGRTNTANLKFAAYGEAHLELTGRVADNRTWANAFAALRILEKFIEGTETLVLEVVTPYSKKTPWTRSLARKPSRTKTRQNSRGLARGWMACSGARRAPKSREPYRFA